MPGTKKETEPRWPAILAILAVSGLHFILPQPLRFGPDWLLLVITSALRVANVLVFASWYWRLDAGGPNARDRRRDHDKGAFLFPQMIMPDEDVGAWSPGFVDYFFLAFNTSTAFSPTDVPVLSPWAKL